MVAPTEIPARRANTLQVMKMAQAFAQLGHSVRLAAPRTNPHISPPGGYAWEELARHYGLQQEFPIDWLPAHQRLRRYDYSLQAVRWAHQQQADLLYTRLPQTAALGSLLGLPTILEIHDLPQGTGGPWLFRRFLKGRGARRMVVITQALAQDMQQQRQCTEAAPDATDYAHAFIGAARALDIPARYVTGYFSGEDGRPAAFHAWAEAWDESLGWICFDAMLSLCPTVRHVRIATGLDAVSAMPVRSYPATGIPQHLTMNVEATAQ